MDPQNNMPIPSSGTIAADENRIACFDRRQVFQWQIRWSDITQIAMWKGDCWAFDMLCMGFLIEGAKTYLGCDEHAKGWDALQSHLLRRYNFKIEDWWDTVVMPPFVENFTVVWER